MQITEARPKRNLISLTSLIDVVFILLVFFMLASTFIKWQFFELAVGESEPLPLNIAKQSIIRIEADQNYWLNKTQMPLEEIVTLVHKTIASDPKHPVLVQPVNDLPLQELVVVLDALDGVAKENVSITRDLP